MMATACLLGGMLIGAFCVVYLWRVIGRMKMDAARTNMFMGEVLVAVFFYACVCVCVHF